MCHGVGVGAQQYPVAPSWDGTTITPGPWTITAGSDQDHTGRTDAAVCTQDGCHAAPWNATTQPPTTTSSVPTTTAQPTLTGEVTIRLSVYGFDPTALTIAAGSTINFVAGGHAAYQIQSDVPAKTR
jgi:hypothetical protein